MCQQIVLHIIHTVFPDSFNSLSSPSSRIPKLPPLKINSQITVCHVIRYGELDIHVTILKLPHRVTPLRHHAYQPPPPTTNHETLIRSARRQPRGSFSSASSHPHPPPFLHPHRFLCYEIARTRRKARTSFTSLATTETN